jgi:hypothetical protein
MRPELKIQSWVHRTGEREVQEQCDGCGRGHPVPELVPIGDGSVQVCRACYEKATAMVLTKEARASSAK